MRAFISMTLIANSVNARHSLSLNERKSVVIKLLHKNDTNTYAFLLNLVKNINFFQQERLW